MVHAVATFLLGFLFGYLGQRARFCTIGGMRDFYLIRDKRLLCGLFGFLMGAFLGFLLLSGLSDALGTFPWVLKGKGFFLSNWQEAGIQAYPSPWLPIPGDPISLSPKVWAHLSLAMIGGFGLGLLSVLAGGCPFRQHVMAAEGSLSALSYLGGFATGAVFFHKFLAPVVRATVG